MKPSTLNGAIYGFVFICLFYIVVASLVFRFRHPWATETQILLYSKNVLFLETVEKP